MPYDEDGAVNDIPVVKKTLGDTKRYIEHITGSNTDDTGDELTSEIAIDNDEPPQKKRKSLEAPTVKIEWSGSEDDTYERFKNRAKDLRKSTAKKKTKAKAKVKDAIVGLKKAKESGQRVEKNQAEWGDDSDYEMMEDSLPKYLQDRRQKFNQDLEQNDQLAMSLPPSYNDIDFSDDEHLADLRERPILPQTVEPSRPYQDVRLPHSLGLIPAPIAQYLRGYQVEGVAFLHELFVYQKGGILGDDMGLGKTVQVAAFLTAAFGKTGDERDAKRMRKMRKHNSRWYPRVLIVCPGSLLENWKQELTRWGWWHIGIYHRGSNKNYDEVLASISQGRLEIMITTYTTYKLRKEEINLVNWDVVVADECHQLKERHAEITKAMNEVNALCRIGLTGTAIQNKYEELWTLLNWTNPGRFGPISIWKSSISDPLRNGQSHDATLNELSQARKTARKLVENLLPQFFLRRMKSLIAHQLPKKKDRVVFCPLTDLQKEAYETFLDSEMVELIKYAYEPCTCGSGLKQGWCCKAVLADGRKWSAMVFPVISRITKLANHLALLIPSSLDPHDKQQKELDFLKEMLPNRWRELYNNRDSMVHLANPEFCGKWSILKKLLHYWHGNGDKVLIFSHSVQLLKMLRLLFSNSKAQYNISYLDGSLQYEDRQKEVDDFNSDPEQFVFLISTKAGGVGLNITSANKVVGHARVQSTIVVLYRHVGPRFLVLTFIQVIMDPNWNPAYDLQAQDRAYRIGQTRDVEVFRLVSSGTIEEIVYARQIYKQQQANIGYNASMERRYFKGVQDKKGQKGEIFGLQNILTFHSDDVVLRDIVNKTNVAEAKAGVDLVDVDMDDAMNDDNNPFRTDDVDSADAAMVQLANLLVDGNGTKNAASASRKLRPKADAIEAILASAGVTYTHENSEVVGTSKVEAHLSRRAEETGNDAMMGDARLFESQSQRVVPTGVTRHLDVDRIPRYEYHPPEAVKVRQFCTMAKMFGFESSTDFAVTVEGWTQEQRRNCLESFYRSRKDLRWGQESVDAQHIDDGLNHTDALELEAGIIGFDVDSDRALMLAGVDEDEIDDLDG